MLDILILWFLNCAVVSCLLFWWFESTLPILVTLVVRRFSKRPEAFWTKPKQMAGEVMDVWTRDDWDQWRTGTLMFTYPKFAHLLGCSRCLSLHFSYLAAFPIAAFGLYGQHPAMHFLFLFVGIFGSTTAAHRLIPENTPWKKK